MESRPSSAVWFALILASSKCCCKHALGLSLLAISSKSCGVLEPVLGGKSCRLLADFQPVGSNDDELKARATNNVVGWRSSEMIEPHMHCLPSTGRQDPFRTLQRFVEQHNVISKRGGQPISMLL